MFTSQIRSWLAQPTSHHSSNMKSSTKNPSSTQKSSGVTFRSNSIGKRQLTQRTSCRTISTSRKAQSPLNGWKAHRRIFATTCWIETLKMDMAIKLHFFGMSWFLTFRLMRKESSSVEWVEKLEHRFHISSLFPPTRQNCSTSENKLCYAIVLHGRFFS